MFRKPHEIQPELFDEFTDACLKPKRKIHRRRIRKRLPPHFTFTLSYENAIISIIVLISLMIISFSLGMERGKRIINPHTSPSDGNTVVRVKEQNFNKNTPHAPSSIEEEKKTLNYAIQVATFKQEALAQKELSRLKKLNYNSFSKVKGKFHLVFVGNYPTKELAKQDLGRLRKIYKDCFIKKVK